MAAPCLRQFATDLSRGGGPGSIPGQVIWDLGHSDNGTDFSLSVSVFSASLTTSMLHTHIYPKTALIRTSGWNVGTFKQQQPSVRHQDSTGQKSAVTLLCSGITGLRWIWHNCRPQKSIHILGCRELFQVELSGTCSSSWKNPPAVSQQPVSGPVECSTEAPCLTTSSIQALRNVRKVSLYL